MSFSECRLAASGSAVPGVAIVYGSPGIAASFRRPGAKLAAKQSNLADVITVLRRNLPKHGMHGSLARAPWRADVLNLSIQPRRIVSREPGTRRQPIGER